MKKFEIEWIDDGAALADFCAHARQQAWVAFDTEFMRDATYYAKLALVQVGTPERVACIDPLALSDLSALEDLLFDANVCKVVHAGSQDLEIFYDRCQQIVQPLFDTQIAASLLGYGEQIGYGPLVEKITGTVLGKGHQRADWMRRPLDHKTLNYAANDVTYLQDVYLQLEKELQQLGRRSWLDAEQASLLDPARYQVDMDTAWHRLKGKQKLRGASCAVARDLAAWRELRAQQQDRPRRRVLSDDQLMDLAQRKPESMREARTLRSISQGMPDHLLQKLLDIVAKAVDTPKDQWPEPFDRHKKAKYDAATVFALQAVLQIQADQHKISPEQLATLSELQQIATGTTDIRTLQGWRKELAGNALLDFLEGRTTLANTPAGLQLR